MGKINANDLFEGRVNISALKSYLETSPQLETMELIVATVSDPRIGTSTNEDKINWLHAFLHTVNKLPLRERRQILDLFYHLVYSLGEAGEKETRFWEHFGQRCQEFQIEKKKTGADRRWRFGVLA